VHESNLKKIVPGQKARVRVDAIKDRTFNGVVSHVSPLPDAQKMWQNPDLKVYKTVIKLVDGGELLKSGMNCVAEIIVDQFDEALFIPLQCVVKENGKNIVYTLNSEGEPEAKEVVLGKDNSSVVQVKSGLSEKELVIQNPPLSKSYSDANRTIIEDAPDTKELSEKISSEYEKRMQRRGALTQKTTEAVTNVVSENKAVKPQIEVVAGQ
jgi:HlyD family secretion protein